MDRERGDEIPYIAEYRRQSPGMKSRLTAEQVEEIREVYGRLLKARKDRLRIQKILDLTPDNFCRIGTGKRGKNPRRA